MAHPETAELVELLGVVRGVKATITRAVDQPTRTAVGVINVRPFGLDVIDGFNQVHQKELGSGHLSVALQGPDRPRDRQGDQATMTAGVHRRGT